MDDLISEFITETSESLAVLDLELVKLERNPNDAEILSNIFRLVHTIKGTCGFLGLPRLESVAHAGENVLGKVRDGAIVVTPSAITLIFEVLDTVKSIMDYLSENGSEPEGSDEDLIRRLNIFADSNGADDGTGAPVSVASVEQASHDVDGSSSAAVVVDASAFEPDEFGFVPVPVVSEFNLPNDVSAPLAPVEVAATPVVTPTPVVAPKPVAKPEVKAEAKPAHGDGDDGTSGVAGQSIRVSLGVLENLMQMVGELVLTRNQLAQIARTKEDNDFKTPLQRLSLIVSELQEGVMKTRMQPIGNAWAKFPRLIRDLSLELDKKIELRMKGAETELDRQLLEMIKDPLTHMVRNSCDHGLETKEERSKTNKPSVGTVTLSAYHEGGHIIVDIIDDGRGINVPRIKQKAVENGLATEDELELMSDHQIAQFIFKAGFSTAEKVTSVSGRGVGMDVVRNNIEKIGGTVELESVPGLGSTFHIKIPLTLAIVSVLVVQTSGQKFAIPQINVVELVRAGKRMEHKVEVLHGSPVLRLRDKLLPLISLSRVLQLPSKAEQNNFENCYIVVCRVGASDYGLIVDTVYDTEEIVVKPVSTKLQHIPIYSGNTVLGDGNVIMILDPNGIAKTSSGKLDNADKTHDMERERRHESRRMVSFLLFSSEGGGPKAVPLELVSRLEEIDVSTIEYSGGRPVIQYRGGLMCLATMGGQRIPSEGMCEIIVFSYDGKVVGLVVDEILDILASEPSVSLVSEDRNYIGTIVMNGRSTDVVDVGYLLSRVLDIDANIGSSLELEKRNARILFVEDSMFFRNLTVPFLSAVGHRVSAVPSALDALDEMKRNAYDLVITDIEMPDMDGFELARLIRQDASYSRIPIIAFTSTINEGFDKKMRASGIDMCALKTEREKLLVAISECMQQLEEAEA
jgi:two-component system chemotaxis sensor kinase CheA